MISKAKPKGGELGALETLKSEYLRRLLLKVYELCDESAERPPLGFMEWLIEHGHIGVSGGPDWDRFDIRTYLRQFSVILQPATGMHFYIIEALNEESSST